MATNNMHNLTTLIKRLEAATLRLEDIASSTIELPQAVPALQQTLPTPSPRQSVVSLPSPPTALPPPAPVPAPVSAPDPLPESIEEFDSIISQAVEKYAAISKRVGGPVAEQAALVLQGFQAQRKYLLITTRAKKPISQGSEMPGVQLDLLNPINEAVRGVNQIKDQNRGSPFFTQLSTVSEGILVLAWIAMEHKPYKHVEECLGSAKFFGNRILKEFKDKDPLQIEWLQAFLEIFVQLTNYVKNFFPNGLTWNSQGQRADVVAASLAEKVASTLPAAGGPSPPPPPPPPGPPPILQIKEQKEEPAPSGGLGAVFSELNKGEAVTQGLRKVNRSEMTHKNPSLRAGSTVPDREDSVRGKSPAPGKKPKPESMRVKKPPKKELEGNKWTIENFEKEPEPIEINVEISHSVLISKCSNTTVVIKGKANAVTVENTDRLSLVVDSLVSTVDAVKSTNFALQVMGAVPTVLMDQIDGAQVYFSKESTATKIFSSKSASINLNVLAGPDEDYKEVPLPSQICSYYDEEKGDLVNEIVSYAG